MPIDGINENGKVRPIQFAAAKSHSANGKNTDPVAATRPDDLQISDRTQEFLRIRQLVNVLPDVRLDRVNQLAQAIDKGTYNVKGEQIAQAIIEKHLIDLKE